MVYNKKAYNQEYRKKNKARLNAQHREYYRKNKEQIAIQRKPYYKRYALENKEKLLIYQREWYRKNRDKRAKYAKKYYQNNKPKIEESRRIRRTKLRKKALERLGNKCIRCGFDDGRALQIDHIHGGGGKARKKMNDSHMAGLILKMSEEELKNTYQCLCANCNWIKRCENNEVASKYV